MDPPDPMPLTFHPTRPRRWPRVITIVAAALAFVLVTNLLDGGKGVMLPALWSAPAWAPWWSAPLRMLCNALPGLLVAATLLAATRRLGLACLVALALEGLIFLVNLLKLRNLGAPLMPADFLMVGQFGAGGGELLRRYAPRGPWPWVGVAGLVLGVALLARYEPPLLRSRWRVRGPLALVLAGAFVSLLLGWTAWKTVYNASRLGMQPWLPRATAAQAGVISSLALFHLDYGSQRTKPDVGAALTLLTTLDAAVRQHAVAIATHPAQRPDIIIILSESLFDPTILNGYADNVDFLPNLHRLARHGISGGMYPPTFGGGTIRTGFEILTGLSLRYFPDIQFPWLQLHQKTIPGIVQLLKWRGYTTIAVHGNEPGFWNRTSAFKALGFDRFVSIDDFAPANRVNDGAYLSDRSFTNELLDQLKTEGPPQFIFGLSIEAHGPYDDPTGIDPGVRDAIPVPAAITGADRTHLQDYIYRIRHADQQLGRLVEALQQRKRRTIVLFFGDHLPALVPAFQAAGFRNGKDFFAQQVPYLIYDTGHPDAAPVTRHVAAWMLPGMVLAQAGIGDTPWFALTEIVGPGLADLTRAPDAPQAQPTPQQARVEQGLRNVARLRLAGKLHPLWSTAATRAAKLKVAPPPSQPLASH